MNTLIILLIAPAIISAIAVAGFVMYGREKTWQRLYGNPDLGPFNLTNIKRGKRPNDAYICSSELCAQDLLVDANLPIFKQSPSEVISAIEQAFKESGLRYSRVDNKSNPAAARFVTWTETFRFPDTNQFLTIPLDSESTGLIAYAKAQIGYSDGGANLKRLVALTDAIPR